MNVNTLETAQAICANSQVPEGRRCILTCGCTQPVLEAVLKASAG